MDKFFELISKLKELGIAAKLCNSSNSTELCEEWNKFLSEYSELVEEIKVWGAEFATNNDSKPIFKESVVIGDSKEVVIIIRVCNDTFYVSECEICENCEDLEKSLEATGEKVAIAVAKISALNYRISEITAEEIFDYIQENLTEEKADTEESEREEDSDDSKDVAEENTTDADTNYDAE